MSGIDRLLSIMTRLRDRETGCPWDISQTFQTIAPYTLEEAYEVVDAIERKDYDALRGELGDLLLQVVFHAQMAAEENLFDFNDVATAIANKMEQRHPHVFGDVPAATPAEVRANWQQIKHQERGDESVMADIPHAMPALKRAQKIGSRATSIGFDWPDQTGALNKLQEELAELHDAIADARHASMEHEMGDVMFSLVNVCRHLGLDAESALGKANRRFTERFTQVERAVREHQERTGETAGPEFMEGHWQAAKKQTKTTT
ncbi:MAG: nucleoside triphosphate pyrophosphohydrolase [Gammaproteobacteria bacterium]|nr:nucleoside triphosphate pyrophosphohydrolase [Gammaproteobacteria bacterium]